MTYFIRLLENVNRVGIDIIVGLLYIVGIERIGLQFRSLENFNSARVNPLTCVGGADSLVCCANTGWRVVIQEDTAMHGITGFFGWAFGLLAKGLKADCLGILVILAFVALVCSTAGFVAGHLVH